MLLSVIIPVFNVEQYLNKCIESVVNQDYKNLEIILVNDGSTDNSLEICIQYQNSDSRIQVINQNNRGLSGARNSGLKIAKGEFIFFLDSDDWIEKNVLSILMKELEDNDVEMLEFSLRMFMEKSQAFQNSSFPQLKIETTTGADFIIKNQRMSPQACVYLYKKQFLDDNNFTFKEKLIHEDEFFNWNCFQKVQKIKKIPILIYNYRIRENSITQGNISIQKLESHIFLLSFLKQLKNSNFTDRNIIESRITNYINQLFKLLINSDFKFSDKFYFIKDCKKEINKRETFSTDAKTLKFEKKIFNFSALSLYFYFKLRKIR